MVASFFVGWVVLIASWVAPRFIKNQENKAVVGMILSSLATGIFVASFLDYIFN